MTGHIVVIVGPTPVIHMVALDFFVSNTESDKALTILAIKKHLSINLCDSDA